MSASNHQSAPLSVDDFITTNLAIKSIQTKLLDIYTISKIIKNEYGPVDLTDERILLENEVKFIQSQFKRIEGTSTDLAIHQQRDALQFLNIGHINVDTLPTPSQLFNKLQLMIQHAAAQLNAVHSFNATIARPFIFTELLHYAYNYPTLIKLCNGDDTFSHACELYSTSISHVPMLSPAHFSSWLIPSIIGAQPMHCISLALYALHLYIRLRAQQMTKHTHIIADLIRTEAQRGNFAFGDIWGWAVSMNIWPRNDAPSEDYMINIITHGFTYAVENIALSGDTHSRIVKCGEHHSLFVRCILNRVNRSIAIRPPNPFNFLVPSLNNIAAPNDAPTIPPNFASNASLELSPEAMAQKVWHYKFQLDALKQQLATLQENAYAQNQRGHVQNQNDQMELIAKLQMQIDSLALQIQQQQIIADPIHHSSNHSHRINTQSLTRPFQQAQSSAMPQYHTLGLHDSNLSNSPSHAFSTSSDSNSLFSADLTRSNHYVSTSSPLPFSSTGFSTPTAIIKQEPLVIGYLNASSMNANTPCSPHHVAQPMAEHSMSTSDNHQPSNPSDQSAYAIPFTDKHGADWFHAVSLEPFDFNYKGAAMSYLKNILSIAYGQMPNEIVQTRQLANLSWTARILIRGVGQWMDSDHFKSTKNAAAEEAARLALLKMQNIPQYAPIFLKTRWPTVKLNAKNATSDIINFCNLWKRNPETDSGPIFRNIISHDKIESHLWVNSIEVAVGIGNTEGEAKDLASNEFIKMIETHKKHISDMLPRPLPILDMHEPDLPLADSNSSFHQVSSPFTNSTLIAQHHHGLHPQPAVSYPSPINRPAENSQNSSLFVNSFNSSASSSYLPQPPSPAFSQPIASYFPLPQSSSAYPSQSSMQMPPIKVESSHLNQSSYGTSPNNFLRNSTKRNIAILTIKQMQLKLYNLPSNIPSYHNYLFLLLRDNAERVGMWPADKKDANLNDLFEFKQLHDGKFYCQIVCPCYNAAPLADSALANTKKDAAEEASKKMFKSICEHHLAKNLFLEQLPDPDNNPVSGMDHLNMNLSMTTARTHNLNLLEYSFRDASGEWLCELKYANVLIHSATHPQKARSRVKLVTELLKALHDFINNELHGMGLNEIRASYGDFVIDSHTN